MGYYMGDYYGIASRRAFGDPGFLSFLKGVGSVVGSVFGLGGGGGATKVIEKVVPAAETGIVPRVGGLIKKGTAILAKHPVLTAAGGAAVGGLASGAASAVASKMLRGRAGGGGEGRRRRMNPFNPRALRRALRRTHSFAKMAKKIVRTERRYKKPRGRFAMGGYGRKKRKG